MAVSKRELVPGKVDPEHLKCLIGFTGITGETVLKALHSHFVEGKKQVQVCKESGLSPSQLSRKVSDIKNVSKEVREAAKFYR
ncbi:PapB/FocB family fimbrial expression transcriptional regulator [Pseudomonas fragariae (ex Marin et al. 2024)]|uniref:PapB/FocB family fimbrial expression transcriptional regulator n=1 Tax=Pseudomonas fragariae (ex Marin et al. 2024) TaxID=3080056 RepID=UPI002A24C8D3|nr:PapB/FocB family fimbrial expression transcriptional regulator [Pseudomonas sp. 20]MDX9625933.1 PapB/FocB family fimbrial expression transcriptional regulator [Pseudomonas sp. 20]